MKGTLMNQTHSTRSKRNPWPYAIAGYFVVFIAFIAAFSTWAVRQKMDLVNKDYYADEILYQTQIDTAARTIPFNSQIVVDYDTARCAINIHLPAEHARSNASGRIHLYRPSDAQQDRELSLAPDVNGGQSVDASRLQPGLWKVRLQWKAAGENFSFAKQIVIGG
jgi:nitrogen fixation protein FixH